MKKSFKIAVCSNTDSSIRNTMDYLTEKEFHIFSVSTEQELFSLLKTEYISLVIIELDLKSKDGISITSEIRNLKGTIEQPYIIIVSGKQDDYIQITALNTGADDFLVTPIKSVLLAARISTFKKRFDSKHENHETTIKNKKFFVDREKYLISIGSADINLPRKEFEMVNLMFQSPNKTFTRKDFANLIWHSPEVANSRTIDIHIRNIRRKLGNDVVKTTKGIGYSINRKLL